MAQIQQIQIKFVAVEDRLLLRVSSSDELEFRFWLTRRFVKLITPAIENALKGSPTVLTQASPIAKKEVFAFEHQKAVNNSDFKTPFKESPKQLPLGSDPILLAKLQMRRNADGTMTMALAPEQGAGIDLALNPNLLHSLAELVSNGIRLAEWDITSTLAQPMADELPDNQTIN
ncbi:MAG: hypothetical protein ACI9BW_000516 [Gammaproteobacteria bacterium]|jgi:hypothetical protein